MSKLILTMFADDRVIPNLQYVDMVSFEPCMRLVYEDEYLPNYFKTKINDEQAEYINSIKHENFCLNWEVLQRFNSDFGFPFNFDNYKKEIFDISGISIQKFMAVIDIQPTPAQEVIE